MAPSAPAWASPLWLFFYSFKTEIPASGTIIVLDLGDVIPRDRQGQLPAIRQQF